MSYLREVSEGEYVQVYYNFHKKCLSVQSKERRVIHYTDEVFLKDAEFYVSEKGRQRVLDEKCKNVHAKIRGYWVNPKKASFELTKHVRYNPYLFDSFVLSETEEAVYEANKVLIKGKDVFI